MYVRSRPDELMVEGLVLNFKFDFGKKHPYGNFENRGKIPLGKKVPEY